MNALTVDQFFFFSDVLFCFQFFIIFEDGHENIADENEFIVETIATHTEYLRDAPTSESSSSCPMLIERPKDEDVYMKEVNIKRDHVRYAVQDKASFFFFF